MTAAATTHEQIERFLATLFEPDDIIEVRLVPAGERAWGRPSDILQWSDRLADRNNGPASPANVPRHQRGGFPALPGCPRRTCRDRLAS